MQETSAVIYANKPFISSLLSERCPHTINISYILDGTCITLRSVSGLISRRERTDYEKGYGFHLILRRISYLGNIVYTTWRLHIKSTGNNVMNIVNVNIPS